MRFQTSLIYQINCLTQPGCLIKLKVSPKSTYPNKPISKIEISTNAVIYLLHTYMNMLATQVQESVLYLFLDIKSKYCCGIVSYIRLKG